MIAYDGNEESIEDPEIGIVKFYLKQWGLNDTPGISFTEVKTRPCREDDFNWDNNPKSKFFPVNKASIKDMKTYSKKMKCLDETGTEIFGSYNTDKASNIMIVFETCDKG